MSKNKTKLKQKFLLAPDFKTYFAGLFTPWNFIAFIILIFGFYAILYRLIFGLGPSTNLSDEYPWGLWIAFDILAGIALAAPGLTIGTAVYILGIKDFKDFAKPAVFSSLIGYIFAVVALLFDLGRYYRVFYPILWSWGLESVLFLIAWHFFLYILICIIEGLPVFFEWLEKEKLREFFSKLALWASALGVIIAGGHQSALGALFLITPNKLHILWYSPLLPLFFLISAISAGISMVIIESLITHKTFKKHLKSFDRNLFNKKILNLGRILAISLGVYLFLKILDLSHQEKFKFLFSDYGILYISEILLFTILPFIGLIIGYRLNKVFLINLCALITAVGIIVNRIIICLIAYKWYIPWQYKYYPTWMEVAVSLAMITLIILSYRFLIRRLPIISH
jgi:Ni/Fe-hydrogenase subunit HybB-like protein